MKQLFLDVKPSLRCNLRCSFCHEQRMRRLYNGDPTLDTLRFQSRVIDRILQNGYSKISMSLMGGELFADFVPDFVHQELLKIYAKVEASAETDLILISNLLTHKLDRVCSFLDQTQNRISVSFDLEGRYTKPKQMEIVVRNLEQLKARGYSVMLMMTLHRPNILHLLNKGPNFPLFEYLYSNFEIATPLYYNNNGYPWNIDLPLIRRFYEWALNYPKLTEIRYLKQKLNNRDAEHEVAGSEVHTLSLIQTRVRFKDLTIKRNKKAVECFSCRFYSACTSDPSTTRDSVHKFSECIDYALFSTIENSGADDKPVWFLQQQV